jgi:hypothetical protein
LNTDIQHQQHEQDDTQTTIKTLDENTPSSLKTTTQLKQNSLYDESQSASKQIYHEPLKRTISSFKNYSSQLLDHVESFNIDLSSIRDILTTQHSFDNSLLENLFTPEQEIQNLEFLNLQNQIQHRAPVNNLYTPIVDNSTNKQQQFISNGTDKTNGNEITHYDPMNPEMLFSIDDVDVLTAQQQQPTTIASIMQQPGNVTQPTYATSALIPTALKIVDNQQQQPSISFVDDDFIINDDFQAKQ